MPSAPAASDVSKSLSAFAKRMALLSRVAIPKPKVGHNGPRTAYMLKKDRSKSKSGAARISAERRFVQGLGYIRADATPVRSQAAKLAASGRSSCSSAPVEATDLQICSELIAISEPETMENVPGPSSWKAVGCLHGKPRFPSTMTRSWISFEYQSE
ncbi:hypothetical protein FRC11_000221 [Ceratobasidium sp. 423]|nr:hypothetical protein FRC11_000221 [Ceratobasidium sp. 423]